MKVHLRVLVFLFFFLAIPQVSFATPLQWASNYHYYEVFQEKKIWAEAKSYAESLGGYLATATSAQETDWLVANFADEMLQAAHIGGWQDKNDPNYSEPGGGWKWVTSEVWDYTNWNVDINSGIPEPNNFYSGGPYEQSLIIYGNWPAGQPAGKWADYSTEITERFVVEWDESYSPTIPEPATLLLLGGGLIGAFIRRKK